VRSDKVISLALRNVTCEGQAKPDSLKQQIDANEILYEQVKRPLRAERSARIAPVMSQRLNVDYISITLQPFDRIDCNNGQQGRFLIRTVHNRGIRPLSFFSEARTYTLALGDFLRSTNLLPPLRRRVKTPGGIHAGDLITLLPALRGNWFLTRLSISFPRFR